MDLQNTYIGFDRDGTLEMKGHPASEKLMNQLAQCIIQKSRDALQQPLNSAAATQIMQLELQVKNFCYCFALFHQTR